MCHPAGWELSPAGIIRVYMAIHLTNHLTICIYIHLADRLYIHLTDRMTIHLHIYLHIRLANHPAKRRNRD
ncbi:MAG: hypothetical protein HQK58_10480 [Deltaproteobacteria bacterium]|nr:hypothetical protein [Deltaproteobacteria bacterium]